MWNRNAESLVSSITGRLPPSATEAPTAYGRPGAEMAEVLVPDDVVRFGLRVGPLEDDGRAAVAHHDAVLRERLGGLDDEPRRVYRRPPGGGVLGELRQLRRVLLDPAIEVGRRPFAECPCSASTSCGTTPRRSPTSGTSIGRLTPMAAGSCSTSTHLRFGIVARPSGGSGRSGIGSPSSVPSATHRSDFTTASMAAGENP